MYVCSFSLKVISTCFIMSCDIFFLLSCMQGKSRSFHVVGKPSEWRILTRKGLVGMHPSLGTAAAAETMWIPIQQVGVGAYSYLSIYLSICLSIYLSIYLSGSGFRGQQYVSPITPVPLHLCKMITASQCPSLLPQCKPTNPFLVTGGTS